MYASNHLICQIREAFLGREEMVLVQFSEGERISFGTLFVS